MRSSTATVVDDVFLLYHDGRLILHETRRLRPDVDSDILSSMLTAVQEFVKDGFKRGGSLDELRIGGWRIVLVRGKFLVLAMTVDVGADAEALRSEMQSCLSQMESDHWVVLASWDGTVSVLEGRLSGYLQRLISKVSTPAPAVHPTPQPIAGPQPVFIGPPPPPMVAQFQKTGRGFWRGFTYVLLIESGFAGLLLLAAAWTSAAGNRTYFNLIMALAGLALILGFVGGAYQGRRTEEFRVVILAPDVRDLVFNLRATIEDMQYREVPAPMGEMRFERKVMAFHYGGPVNLKLDLGAVTVLGPRIVAKKVREALGGPGQRYL